MNKKEKEIRDILNNHSIPSYDEDAPMNAIEFIHKNYSSIPKFRTSNKQFILSQIGFIRKRTWVFQILILALICSVFYNVGRENSLNFETFSLISILSPLLLIINVDDISRIYNKSMLEIEFSTKNSLKKVLAIRMLILGITDCIVLIIMMIFATKLMNISIFRVIMYAFVPFNLVCIGSMELMKYFKGLKLNYACTIYSTLLMVSIILGNVKDLGIYAQKFILIWMLIYVITTVILVFQMKKFWNRLDFFHNVIKEVSI